MSSAPRQQYAPGVDSAGQHLKGRMQTRGRCAERAQMGETAWCVHRIETIARARGFITERQAEVRASCMRLLGIEPTDLGLPRRQV